MALTMSQYYDHQQSRQKLFPHCTLWVERVRPRQAQGCEGALSACLVQYLFVCCRDCIFFIMKVLATPSCDICPTVQRPDTKKCDQTSQVHLFPKVPPDCAITVGGFRLRLCLGWLL